MPMGDEAFIVGMYPNVERAFLLAKTGKPEDCEDAIYVGKHFVAVLDGATAGTTRRWDGETGGKVAARILKDACSLLPIKATAREAINFLTSALQKFYEDNGVYQEVFADPAQRATASIVIVCLWRNEVWFVGDCQCLLDQMHVQIHLT